MLSRNRFAPPQSSPPLRVRAAQFRCSLLLRYHRRMRFFLLCALVGCGSDLPPPDRGGPDLGESAQPTVDLAGLSGSHCYFWPTVQPVQQISGWSADDLFALTADGQLVHSSDRFASQTEVATPSALASIGRSFAGTLFAVNVAGGLYRSSDAANSWAGVALPAPARFMRTFSDGAVYLKTGDFDTLMVSHDDGDHWFLLDVGRQLQISDVYAVGSEIFAAGSVTSAAGYTAAVAHSSDGGTTWSLQPLLDRAASAAIWGSSADDLYAVGFSLSTPDGVAFHSTDRGASWKPLTVSGDPFSDVRGSAARVYIASQKSVSASDDHGATWDDECTFTAGGGLWADPAGGALLSLGTAQLVLLP
jgi:photosystem II stability/assembly factor-like uncharacterized protein